MTEIEETIELEESHPTHLTTLTFPPLCLEVYSEPPEAESKYCTAERFQAIVKRILPRVETLWTAFLGIIEEQEIPAQIGLSAKNQQWEVDVTFVTNPQIQSINAEYRHKNQATDVLTFTLLADSPVRAQMTQLPTVQLGEIYISIEWALAAIEHPQENKPTVKTEETEYIPDPSTLASNLEGDAVLDHYILERLAHGLLHLLGINHDTFEEYNRVVAIQRRALDEVFNQ